MSKNLISSFIKKYRNSSNVFKASVWFIGASVFNNCVSIITQPIINRILSVEEIGLYNVFITWHSIFLVLSTLNLFAGVLEMFLTEEIDKSRSIISSLSTLSILFACLFFALLLITYPLVEDLIIIPRRYLVVMGIYIVSEAVIQFWCSEKRFRYQYKVYSGVLIGLFMAKAFSSIILSVIFVDDRVMGRILGLMIPSFITSIFLFYNIGIKKPQSRNSTEYWKRAVLFNLPLIPHYLTTIMMSSADRIMIQQLDTIESVGLYSIVYSYSSIALIVFNSINSAYTPFALKAIKDEKYIELRNKTNYIIVICTIAVACMIIMAPEGLLILGGVQYLPTLGIVSVLLIGIFFSSFYYIFSNVEFVYKKNKIIFPITLMGAFINIGLNYYFIPIIGYEAAAYTTLASYLFIFIAHGIVSFRIVKKIIFDYKVIVISVVLLTVISVFSIILFKISVFVRILLVILLLVMLFCIFKKIRDTH